jgi:phosphoribosylanthranilate isomerase
MKTQVKVCGLRRPEDVDACLDLGIDHLGFNCWPRSPRYAPPSLLESLVARVEGRAEVVLVVVDAAPDDVLALLDQLASTGAPAWVQLHGGQDPAAYTSAGSRIIQVLRVGGEAPFPAILAERALLDVHHADFGGTGLMIDRRHVEALRPRLPREWMLAGGLSPSNVGDAIRALRPWGVDVASGVEQEPGVKDRAKLEAFVSAVRGTDPLDAS